MKNYLSKGIKFLKDKDYRFNILSNYGFYDSMDDEEFLKRKFKSNLKYDLNLLSPNTFSEKIQWLKINDRKDIYTILVDKYKVREYIKEKLGEEYLIPLIGIWDDPDDIDFNKLPDQFVLKCNHNSGLGMCICKDKSKLDISKVRRELKKGLKQDYYLTGREWPYKNVSRKIIAEKYMKNEHETELKDYKFFCFNGEPKYCQVISDRSTNETIDFFDMNWEHQEFIGLNNENDSNEFTNSKYTIEKPVTFEKMKEFAYILAKNTKFVRIDFYEIERKLYFGEITFYPASGFGNFKPSEWNEKLGEMVNL